MVQTRRPSSICRFIACAASSASRMSVNSTNAKPRRRLVWKSSGRCTSLTVPYLANRSRSIGASTLSATLRTSSEMRSLLRSERSLSRSFGAPRGDRPRGEPPRSRERERSRGGDRPRGDTPRSRSSAGGAPTPEPPMSTPSSRSSASILSNLTRSCAGSQWMQNTSLPNLPKLSSRYP